MRNHLMPLMLGLTAAIFATACGENSPPEEETISCSCECTTADPVPHCVNTQDCRSTADCPAGTVCAALPAGVGAFPEATGSDPLAACGSSSPSKRCQLPAGSMGRQTLNTGFEVEAFALLRMEAAE